MDRKDRAGTLAALAGIALLSTGWCATALGASSSLVPCDEAGTDLQSLEVAVSDLTVNVVDHMMTSGDAAIGEVLDPSAGVRDSATPVLFLTPRITTILRGVFDTDSNAATSDEASDADAPAPSAQSEATEKLAPVTLIDQAAEIPRFQRQMYRKDI